MVEVNSVQLPGTIANLRDFRKSPYRVSVTAKFCGEVVAMFFLSSHRDIVEATDAMYTIHDQLRRCVEVLPAHVCATALQAFVAVTRKEMGDDIVLGVQVHNVNATEI